MDAAVKYIHYAWASNHTRLGLSHNPVTDTWQAKVQQRGQYHR